LLRVNRDTLKTKFFKLKGDGYKITDCAKVKKVINHGIIDSSGLTYENEKLYIVSDTNDALYIYDIKNREIDKKIELSKFAQEGVAFGQNDDIFFADDS